MSGQAIFCGLGAAIFLWLTWECIRHGEDDGRWTLVCFAVTVVFAYFSYQGTTPAHLAEVEADRRAAAERERKERTPHVVREADGCKVYAWKGGDRYHYFTRCPDSRTSTQQNWQECTGTGKHRTCKDMTETIEVTR